MSYTEWENVEYRQDARRSGKRWRRIETYEANSPAGSLPIKEIYQIAVEKSSHHEG